MAWAGQESELPAIDAFVRVAGDGIVARGSAGAVAGLVAALAADPAAQVALCGDWNIAPRDEDVFDITAFAKSTHVTPPERAAFTVTRIGRLNGSICTTAMRM